MAILPHDELEAAVERLDAHYRDAGQRQASTVLYVDRRGLAVWLATYIQLREQMVDAETAMARVLMQIDRTPGFLPGGVPEDPQPPLPLPPLPAGDVKPIVGFVRRHGRLAGDDHGPRRLQGCSWFPGIRVFMDDRDAALRQLDRIQGRWHFVRVFWHLAHAAWQEKGCAISPLMPGFEAAFRGFLLACKEREIRVSLTCGDLQFLADREHLLRFRHVAGLVAAFDQQTVGITGMVNEARVNSRQGEDWAYWADLSDEWQKIAPWGLHGLSDPGSQEEMEGLHASSRHPATLALIHGTRHDWIAAIRRSFNRIYEGTLTKPLCEDEPTNMGRDVYQPVDTPAQVFAIHTMAAMTGQILTHFGDASLWNGQPLDTDWGFTELPRLWREMELPDRTIRQYTLIPGHRPEAPLTADQFEVPHGSGPHRVDQIVSETEGQAFAIVYGGHGLAHLRSRWDADWQVWAHNGLRATGRVSAGEGLPKIRMEEWQTALVRLVRR